MTKEILTEEDLDLCNFCVLTGRGWKTLKELDNQVYEHYQAKVKELDGAYHAGKISREEFEIRDFLARIEAELKVSDNEIRKFYLEKIKKLTEARIAGEIREKEYRDTLDMLSMEGLLLSVKGLSY